ncbi:MAG TPA: DUF5671 domain-containing protein [Candidatus Baltobacteraceae bacterium]|nr:DUF5671 domain-containing protein [Candidatus Baltobacteraceae bacterium]
MSTLRGVDVDLSAFLRTAKEHGVSDEFVVAMLRQNGWSERRIYRAYTAYYADVLGTPLPARNQPVEHSRDAFLYLLNFITLGFWTVALGQVFYILIAHRFPDLTQQYPYEGSLREQLSWQVAAVIVAFPIYLFVHNIIQRQLRVRPDMYDSGVRRWLTYIALVFAAIIVITDAVWFIEALIRGELTTRFILDSLVLLVLGGGVFAYYLITMDPLPAAATE